jgi:Tfp pilus assembly protein PilP
MNRILALIIVSVCLPVSGCGNDDMSDLESFISAVENRPAAKNIEPLPELKLGNDSLTPREIGRDPFVPLTPGTPPRE